jgi:signal transduction histidine kinase
VSVRVLPDGSVTVTDQGIGISPEDRPRIFQRFWRGKGVSTSGAGLGLAIVKEIVAAHHGTIQIDNSPPGKGAAFTLRFSPWIGTDAIDQNPRARQCDQHRSAR